MMSNYYVVGGTPIGSGPRKDTSGLFSFNFGKKSQKKALKSSSRTVASDGPKPRPPPSTSLITATPKADVDKRAARRKLTSANSSAFISITPDSLTQSNSSKGNGSKAVVGKQGKSVVKKGKRKLGVNNYQGESDNDDGGGGGSVGDDMSDDGSVAVVELPTATPPKRSKSKAAKKEEIRSEAKRKLAVNNYQEDSGNDDGGGGVVGDDRRSDDGSVAVVELPTPPKRSKSKAVKKKRSRSEVNKRKLGLGVNNYHENFENDVEAGGSSGVVGDDRWCDQHQSTSLSDSGDGSVGVVELPTPPKRSKLNVTKQSGTGSEVTSEQKMKGGDAPSSSGIPTLPPVFIHLKRLREDQIEAYNKLKSEIPKAEEVTTSGQDDPDEAAATPPSADNNNDLTEQATLNMSSSIEDDDNENVVINEDVEVMHFQVEENVDNYNALRNSEMTHNRIAVEEKLTKGFASFVTPEIGALRENAPGVACSVINASESLNVGYVTIEARTVKPFDCMENVQLLYWILSGTVTIRSTGGYYTKGEEPNTTNYLYGKSLPTGSCIMIPANTCFTVENWGDSSSLIGYCAVF